MELHQVRYFIALSSTLNFTRAAETCNVTQSALTRAIQRLEEELGGPLLQRERHLTQLSELGRLMRPLLEQSLAMADAAKQCADKFRKGEEASLRLGLPTTIFAGTATPILAEVVRRLPALEIEISAEAQHRLVEKLLQGELDVAFLGDDGEVPERLKTWSLYKERFQIAVADDHPLAKLETVSVQALAGESIVELRGCPMAAKLRALYAQTNVTFRTRHLVDTEAQLQQMAATSLCIGLIPETIPVTAPLVTRSFTGADLVRAVVLAVVNGRRFSPALALFVRIARARDFAAKRGFS
jgi:DNA-binding transcriptional LysR family regulator